MNDDDIATLLSFFHYEMKTTTIPCDILTLHLTETVRLRKKKFMRQMIVRDCNKECYTKDGNVQWCTKGKSGKHFVVIFKVKA
jgi:hypothetical protein